MQKIEAPTNCPSCNSVLSWENHILYCRNPDCTSQVDKRIEHFGKTLKIKGLGPKTIEKLNLSSFAELYSIEEEYIANAIGSEVMAEKLKIEIENSKKATLNELLPAFSIRLIGRSAAQKLSFNCEDIYDINEDRCQQAGLGPKATENLMNWLEDKWPALAGLPFSWRFEKTKAFEEKGKGTVCITGRLSSFKTKALAKTALMEAGYNVKDNLTKDVTILINESGIESSKTKKASDAGVIILTSVLDLIGENT